MAKQLLHACCVAGVVAWAKPKFVVQQYYFDTKLAADMRCDTRPKTLPDLDIYLKPVLVSVCAGIHV